MVLKVKFLEQSQEIPCDFGEVHEISDAEGYGKGYNDGKKDGYADGYGDGETAGHAAGFEDGKQAGYDEGYDKGYNKGLEDGASDSPSSCDFEALIDGSITDVISNSTKVRDYLFYRCESLKSAQLPLALSVKPYAFNSCSNLISVSVPLATEIGTQAFRFCPNLKTVDLARVEIINSAAFNSCAGLEKVDLPNIKSIAATAFLGARTLSALILRTHSVCSLGNVNVFNNTPIASGTGYIYVPSALVDSYKTATNWTTYANQFRAIEDYPEITGGTA